MSILLKNPQISEHLEGAPRRIATKDGRVTLLRDRCSLDIFRVAAASHRDLTIVGWHEVPGKAEIRPVGYGMTGRCRDAQVADPYMHPGRLATMQNVQTPATGCGTTLKPNLLCRLETLENSFGYGIKEQHFHRRFPRNVTRSMTRLITAALCIAIFGLTGCDNRTRDGKRWDQIAEIQRADKTAQPWPDARSPWSEAEHHSGLAW
ncbi:MAG TPA: hypothetical protein VE860_25510 [Chthoniobacterales bacterium]|nr:hypothetical protein [Chthoniobacterales bacterium]